MKLSRLTISAHANESGAPPAGRVLRRIAGQTALVSLAALIYFGVRGLTQDAIGSAVDNGKRILDIEGFLHIRWEWAMQEAILDHSWLVALANWVYIYGHWPAIVAALLWLALRHPDKYVTLRNALFISGAIGIVIFIVLPTAPPRMLDVGLVDTVSERSSSYRALQPPGLLNKHAAMPSLHFGWNLLVGVALYRAFRSPALRVLAVLLPTAMGFAVVATANHYVLDAIAGAAVALAGLALVAPVDRTIAKVRGVVAR